MLWNKYLQAEIVVSQFLRTFAISCLRYSLAIIYFWYGLLKVLGISPIEELVFHATHWMGTHQFVIYLGVWEMAIGIFLLFPKLQRIALLLLFLQFPGTFLPLFFNPEDCFTIIPYGLTLEGQYIFKNLILISGALILVSHLHPPKKPPNNAS